MNRQEKLYDKRVRWQETRIKQFSYVNYLVLTLALAASGFVLTMMPNNSNYVVSFLCTYQLPFICFVLSILLGIWCANNRLRDFRATARITKLKYKGKDEDENGNKIDDLRALTKKLGQRSWIILWWQIGLFVAGILLPIAIIFLSKFILICIEKN